MIESTIVSPLRPKTVGEGARALGFGVERYVLKGGGSMIFSLDEGDVIELALLEGGQAVEAMAFSPTGKPDLGALGLTARHEAKGVHAVLSTGSEDAERVRFGLFRRGVDIGRAKCARLFGADAPAGEAAAFTAVRPVTAIFAAPDAYMLVWEQNPPTDVLIHINRAHPAPMGKPRLPEPLAEPRLDLTVNIASAISFEVFAGEYIQIIDVAGRQCSDFLAFQRRALDKGKLMGLDSTTTRSMTGTAYPRPGLYSKFFDRDRNALVEVIRDTVGRHDTFNLACTNRYYEDMGYFGHANCSDNFNGALAEWQIEAWRGWPAINFFFNTNVDAKNNIWFDEPWSRPGDYVLMRALDDLVCGTSSCPCDIDPANGWNLTEIHVRVYPKTASFTRAIGTRMTPDAPMKLTQETGFHPRTSALTRNFAEYRGYWLPNSFAANGAIDEYWACRERAALMDLSPLRKVEVMGPDAEALMQRVVTRDVSKLAAGQVVYTAMCYEHGGMVDDGTVFRLAQDNFRWVGGDELGLLWIKEQAKAMGANVLLKTATDQIHNVALQGPESRDILRGIVWTPPARPTIDELGWFRFTVGRIGHYDGIPILVSRTGYTGELGYEIFCHPNHAPAVWDAIMAAGKPHGVAPFGLEALDMVRIEAGLIFGGYDFDSTTDPLEAGIGFAVPPKKAADYIGKAAIEARRASPRMKLVGLELAAQEKAAPGDAVYVGRAHVGKVTSATRSPVLKKNIALARVEATHAANGTVLEIGKLDGMQKRLAAIVVPFPFYDPEKTRVRA
jgi:aminomethyltransferase